MHPIEALREEISSQPPTRVYGRVVAIRGLLVEVAGPVHLLCCDQRCEMGHDDQQDHP